MTRGSWILIASASLAIAAGDADASPPKARQAAKLVRQGVDLLEHEQYRKAEHLFRKAVGLSPSSPSPHFYLGKALALSDRCKKALPELERYLLLTSKGQLADEATALIRRCREMAPASSDIRGNEERRRVPTPRTARTSPLTFPIELRGGYGVGLAARTPAGFVIGGVFGLEFYGTFDLTFAVVALLPPSSDACDGCGNTIAVEMAASYPVSHRSRLGGALGFGSVSYDREESPADLSGLWVYLAPELTYTVRALDLDGFVGVRGSLGRLSPNPDSPTLESAWLIGAAAFFGTRFEL